jgi:hypothetical protein
MRFRFRIVSRDVQEDADAPHPLRLLRARRERPSDRRAAEKRDELSPLQLIELHSVPVSQGRIVGYRISEGQSGGNKTILHLSADGAGGRCLKLRTATTPRREPLSQALVMVESFSNGVEAVMTYASRLLAGILLIVLPTVMIGGVSILSLLIGDPSYMENPLRQDLWRAGHAHAGVWLILALVALRYVDEANLSNVTKWLVAGLNPPYLSWIVRPTEPKTEARTQPISR